jgi:hypothetical protein
VDLASRWLIPLSFRFEFPVTINRLAGIHYPLWSSLKEHDEQA